MPKKSTVYRIEDADGDGVYRGAVSLYNYPQFNEFSQDRRHPVPREDSKLMNALPKTAKEPDEFSRDLMTIRRKWIESFIFGFSSLGQLRAWFYDDTVLEWLHDNGFKLVAYEGVAYHGNAQSIIRKKSKKINEYSLMNLLSK